MQRVVAAAPGHHVKAVRRCGNRDERFALKQQVLLHSFLSLLGLKSRRSKNLTFKEKVFCKPSLLLHFNMSKHFIHFLPSFFLLHARVWKTTPGMIRICSSSSSSSSSYEPYSRPAKRSAVGGNSLNLAEAPWPTQWSRCLQNQDKVFFRGAIFRVGPSSRPSSLQPPWH